MPDSSIHEGHHPTASASTRAPERELLLFHRAQRRVHVDIDQPACGCSVFNQIISTLTALALADCVARQA